MKRPILTASLHLMYAFPVVAQVLPVGEPHIAIIQMDATVNPEDGYKNGAIQTMVLLNRRPDLPLKISIEIRNETLTRLPGPGGGAAVGGSIPGRSPVGGGSVTGPNAAGILRRDLPMPDSVLTFSIPVPRPKLWSAETPALYTVSVRLLDSSGRVRSTELRRIGFRRVEMGDSGVILNGAPVWIRGIGAADPATVAGDSLLRDIQLMKQFNVNAVQAEDYPDNEAWYRLCDEYGIYVIDKGSLSGKPVLSEDKQRTHPCIISWPMGRSLVYERLRGNSLGGFKDAFQRGFVLGFIGKALTASEGHPSPAAWEMRKCYQPIHTVLNPGGWVIRVTNEQFFQDLSNLSLEWELWVNGKSRQKGSVAQPAVLPRQSANIRLPVVTATTAKDEVILNIRYKLKKKESWAPAGFVIAGEQLMVRKGAGGDVAVLPDGELAFKDEGGLFTISSPFCNLQFNKQTGWLQHYVVNNNVLLEEAGTGDSAGSNPAEEVMPGLSANFWRAPTDLDRAAGYPVLLAAWKHSTREPRLQLFSTSTASDIVIVKADYSLPETFCILHVHYTVNAHGELQVQESMEADTTMGPGNTGVGVGDLHNGQDTAWRRPVLPRYGMKWILPAGFDSVTWFGRGPMENYEDRADGADLGVYRQTVEEQFYPYQHPQETGTKTGVRWWRITNKEGHGLLFTADSLLLSVSALHYYDGDLDSSGSSGMALKPRAQTELNIDYRQMGIGGDHFSMKPAYLLKDVNYSYQFKVTPL